MRELLIILSLSLILGAVRQTVTGGITWQGRWPTSDMTAKEAYETISQKEDPSFVSLTDAIRMHGDPKVAFIDARAPKDFTLGHIPQARLLPFYELDHYMEPALGGINAKDTRLILYCEGVGCELSLFLGRVLKEKGYQNVCVFYGGYPEWVGAGLPVEKG